MNKVICDICGTMYPENAAQCPICGCAKPAGASAVQEDGVPAENENGAYGQTKGGHFSKGNVRRRNKSAEKVAQKAANVAAVKAEEHEEEPEETTEESNKGLIIAIVLLIVAIVGMLCYIFFTYFAGNLFGGDTTPTTTVATTTQSTETGKTEIKCQGLDLQVPDNKITLESLDHAWLLNVVATPADTTDEITYTSSNTKVAAVSSDGRVTAVGAGTATITVTCGDVVKECKVVCDFATDETIEETTEETTEATTKPTEEKVDVSKFYLYPRRDGDCTIDVGESFRLQLRDGKGKKVDVTWTATVEGYFEIDGDVITGIKSTPKDANAADKIRATCTYEGVEFSCIIRVRPEVPSATTKPTESTEPSDSTESTEETTEATEETTEATEETTEATEETTESTESSGSTETTEDSGAVG